LLSSRGLAAGSRKMTCTLMQSLRCHAVDDLEKLVATTLAEETQKHGRELDFMAELSAENVADRPWSAVFEPLARDPGFRRELWAKKPFKLSTKLPFAVNCFTFQDLEEYAHLYPSHWAGTGTIVASGGWMMASVRRDAGMNIFRPDPEMQQCRETERRTKERKRKGGRRNCFENGHLFSPCNRADVTCFSVWDTSSGRPVGAVVR
jgi:hypothetical protein